MDEKAREHGAKFQRALLLGLVAGVAAAAALQLAYGRAGLTFHGGFWSAALVTFALTRLWNVDTNAIRAAADGDLGLAPGEVALRHGPANHKRGFEMAGGKLTLTNERLRFRPHALNLQTGEASFPLTSIRAVDPAATLGIVPNSIELTLADGRKERFVVSARTQWITAIRSVLSTT